MQGLDVKVQLGEMKMDVGDLAGLLTTSYQNIFTAAGDSQIVGLELVNVTAGAQTVSMEVFPSGGASGQTYQLALDLFSVGAHTQERFWSITQPYFLRSGDTVAIKASAGSAIRARLMVLEPRG